MLRTAETCRVSPDFAGLALRWIAAERTSRLLVTRGLDVLWANEAAVADLTFGGDIEIRDGRLMFSDPAHHAQLASAMTAVPAGCHCLPCTGEDGHVIVRFSTVESADSTAVFGLTIRRAATHRSTPAVDLARVFGLTAAEIRVVRKLLDGLTAEDAAAELTIGIETVRSHIRQIYSKMGVRSREALFQRIMPYCF